MNKKQCSVCKWFEVDLDDPLADDIKKRHAMRHTKFDRFSERDGHKITRNITVGEVEWI